MPVMRWSPAIHHLASPENPRLAVLELARFRPRPIRCCFPTNKLASSISLGSARSLPVVRAGVETLSPAAEIVFSETFPLRRTQKVEGKVWVRLDAAEEDGSKCKVVIGCDLEGKWILHWGVSYLGESGREWDQPPPEMRPPGSVPIKDFAIETPLEISSSSAEGRVLHDVQITFDSDIPIATINFVLKEEETGAWFQHKGRDFRISLNGSLEDEDPLEGKQRLGIWPGALEQISSILMKSEGPTTMSQETVFGDGCTKRRCIAGFYKEYSILKEEHVQNFMTVTVRKSNEMEKNEVQFDTDIPGQVIVHWGVCKDNTRTWEIPSPPHPPTTKIFRQKALQTLLEPKAYGLGSCGLFSVDAQFSGLVFVLKLNEYTWLNDMNKGSDFYIPLMSATSSPSPVTMEQSGSVQERPQDTCTTEEEGKDARSTAGTDKIISVIRNVLADLSSRKGQGAKTKELQENILQEIEKLAAEAYSMFRSSSSSPAKESASFAESLIVKPGACSGTGSGYEILCQGFNWESHKSGRWYLELGAKSKELSSLGFTIVWLPPPTESVSPEGYMPKDLYNLNSRYGSIEQLKDLVKIFHEVGVKVLGDAVLNHRCAHYQNQNGIWNIFGGRLNWDDRAIVADDPHFQGRGNKSSGDNFHAAPNIDHSQDFVRKDLKEWLCWLRSEIGYDGWRLDFVRGFWGGYVKDYLEASEPYFAVGEYWDSLSYTYGEMDYNQDAHRQRIIDWINATNGTAGAFDVTTKGILHSALERCEYWRLSDDKGKPPGVLGWWPSRAVTFIENHDTGSTQGHWRFPSCREMQGYAYILTHPGTPAVFYDHIFSHFQQEISSLIFIRHRQKVHCRSKVKITKAEKDVYAAEIDDKIAMKIGPGHYEPSDPKWVVAAEGRDYKVWEASE